MNPVYFFLVASVLLNTLGQFFAKTGAHGMVVTSWLGSVTHIFTTPALVMSAACYGMSLFFWVFVLSKMEVSMAASFFSVSYLLTVLMGVIVFNEPACTTRIAGFLMILGGIYLISTRA
ncbi:hypothetical protein [Candidatus Hepatobacter penaei]|uniref:hypothetical protein n=1 Tax=Candidatus Hepatobacter penaei TaxID=1274402 RepID=UPI000696C074|nr:hypothetical protein [Candidatus Hepatobacter penaei]TGW15537.1 hypothetical protein EIL50_01190 [bacterium NHP-B]